MTLLFLCHFGSSHLLILSNFATLDKKLNLKRIEGILVNYFSINTIKSIIKLLKKLNSCLKPRRQGRDIRGGVREG